MLIHSRFIPSSQGLSNYDDSASAGQPTLDTPQKQDGTTSSLSQLSFSHYSAFEAQYCQGLFLTRVCFIGMTYFLYSPTAGALKNIAFLTMTNEATVCTQV